MLGHSSSRILAVSRDQNLLHALDTHLRGTGAQIYTVASPHEALALLSAPDLPCLVLADADVFFDFKIDCFKTWLHDVHAGESGHRVSVVLLSDIVSDEWTELVISGVLYDLIPRPLPCVMGHLRLAMVLRSYNRMREVEVLRETADMEAQLDPLTHIYNRGALLSILFRETDRVQRMKTPLSVILFDLDEFGQCNQQIGRNSADDLLRQVVARTARLLRSYDAFGRMDNDEFLLALPGCATSDALILAERLRTEVFSAPFSNANEPIQLSACFGIAPSQGRSPIVVLRAAEQALELAKLTGRRTIHCAGSSNNAPADFLSEDQGEKVLAW
jgi:two-component system, cell cycle response regulator